jgi:hypothetical protein
MDDWALQFANHHGLDVSVALAQERAAVGARRLQRLLFGIRHAWRYFRLYQPAESALPNIFDACLAAQRLLDRRPSITANHVEFVLRTIQRKLSRHGKKPDV